MEKSFASFTIITFLFFAVSTARISLNPPATNLPAVQSSDVESKSMKSLPGPDTTEDTNIILPSETPKSSSDETRQMPESNKDRMFKVDLTPRSDFARFHAINRHFVNQPRIPVRSVNRRPNRHSVNPFVVPRSEFLHENKVVLFGETSNVDAENSHRQPQWKRLRSKHDYGHRHHRHQYRHHLHHDNKDVSMPKHVFGREKPKSLARQHKEKKSQREHEASFMKGIRKFLKHTFD
ncbi:hypothetical protein L1887_27338 [Cichorium endivia]|nr:hypothetical protein L1887_27338 [Cichorium endivia]